MRMSLLEYDALLKRRGTSGASQDKIVTETRSEIRLLHQIQALAKQHGWLGQDTISADTQEVECLLVRGVILYALLHPDQTPLTPRQLAWVTALRATGAIEVYIWQEHDIEEIRQRLARKRGS